MSIALTKTPGACLTARIRRIVPRAETVRVTATTHHYGPEHKRGWVALVLDDRHTALPVPAGGVRRLVAELRAAYPTAPWTGSQCWTASTGALIELRPKRSAYAYREGTRS